MLWLRSWVRLIIPFECEWQLVVVTLMYKFCVYMSVNPERVNPLSRCSFDKPKFSDILSSVDLLNYFQASVNDENRKKEKAIDVGALTLALIKILASSSNVVPYYYKLTPNSFLLRSYGNMLTNFSFASWSYEWVPNSTAIHYSEFWQKVTGKTCFYLLGLGTSYCESTYLSRIYLGTLFNLHSSLRVLYVIHFSFLLLLLHVMLCPCLSKSCTNLKNDC